MDCIDIRLGIVTTGLIPCSTVPTNSPNIGNSATLLAPHYLGSERYWAIRSNQEPGVAQDCYCSMLLHCYDGQRVAKPRNNYQRTVSRNFVSGGYGTKMQTVLWMWSISFRTSGIRSYVTFRTNQRFGSILYLAFDMHM